MLGYYKNSRNKIVKVIKKSPKTNDGYYFVRDFPNLNAEQGKVDNGRDTSYFYYRNLFKDKFVFSDADIEAYLAKKNTNFDFEKMQKLDEKLVNVIDDYLQYDLNDDIKDKLYNLNELIDTTIFVFNSKY